MSVCRRRATVEFLLPLRFPEQAVVRARAGEDASLSGTRAAWTRVDNAR